MIIIRNRLLPIGRRYGAINLCGILFIKPEMALTPDTLNHEQIHTRQMIELLIIGFYIAYIIEWIYRLLTTRFNNYRAYRAISFEREAYDNESNHDYLKHRKLFATFRGKSI